MTKITKVVDFHSYIFADLTRNVISQCISVCCDKQNLTPAHSYSHDVEVLTKRNVEMCHLAPTVWGKTTYRKVILFHCVLHLVPYHLYRLSDS